MTHDIGKYTIVGALKSLKLTLVILAIFAIGIAVATFIEARLGTPAARALVYDALWFELLLGLLIVNLTVSLVANLPYRRSQLGYLLGHIGFIVVLLAAGVTRYFGYEGRMPIREGASTDFMFSNDDHVQLEIDGKSASFAIRPYKAGPMSVHRKLTVGDETFAVSVQEYWPHAGRGFVEGEGGKPAVTLATADGQQTVLRAGDSRVWGDIRFHFDPEEQPGREHPLGELVLHVDGEHHRLVVPRKLPAELVAGGYRCRIVEFTADYRVGRTPQADDEMNNPAIRVEFNDPSGHTHEKLLFAYHPEFDMQHAAQGGQSDHGPDMSYIYTRTVRLFAGENGVSAKADFPVLTDADGAQGGNRMIAVGESFALETGRTLRSGRFAARATQVLRSAVERAVQTENQNHPPAVRLTVEDAAGNRVETVALQADRSEPTQFELAGRTVRVALGPTRIALPYALHLDDFVLTTYPGSENPASFESHVRIVDEEMGVKGEPVRIYMNHPLTYRGFKHFQSSYDSDRRGTILSVNHDPGKWPTYFGYTLIGIGLLVTLTRGMWLRRMRPVAGAAILLTSLLFAPQGAVAQSQEEHSHQPTRDYLSTYARQALSRLMAQDFQGRMKPLDTLSRESVMKVGKRHHLMGWEPMDMYLSWMAHTAYWFQQPIIAVRHPDVKSLLGVDASVSHVTPSSLLDEAGEYRLTEAVEAAHRTPPAERSKMQQKLLSLDERVNVFYMTVRGRNLRVFPLPGDPNNRWLGPGEFDQQTNTTMSADALKSYQTAFSDLYHGLQTLDNTSVLKGAHAIGGIQAQYGADVIPSERARSAELQLNKLQPFTWVTLPYLAVFALLMAAYAWRLVRRHGARFPLRHPLYALGMILYAASALFHLYGYVLRWVAAGHAPLSNGYESLIFIALAIAFVGAHYELKARNGSIAALSALLIAVILGVAMLPTFDPAISPLVPVLASFWLIVHVTIITASYGFLGLAALIAMSMLLLYLFKGPGRMTLQTAILELHLLHWNVMIAGLAFLTVGTFLGGVWANESWGRYWGWDPKETWALVTILVYAFVVHTRFVDRLNRPVNIAAGSLLSISTVGMTYFGVNYFLAGLHSYAQGSSPGVPGWVYVMGGAMVTLAIAAIITDRSKSWRQVAKPGSHKEATAASA